MMFLFIFPFVFLNDPHDSLSLKIRLYLESSTVRCEALAAQNEVSSRQELQKELEELNLQYKRLKVPCLFIVCCSMESG